MFRRFFGRDTPNAPDGDTAMAILFERGLRVDVVGEANYQDALSLACGGRQRDGVNHECIAALIPEGANPFDPDAIEIRVEGRRVGYLNRQAAQAYKPVRDALAARGRIGVAHAMICGGWDRDHDDLGSFGVWLDMDPFTWLNEASSGKE